MSLLWPTGNDLCQGDVYFSLSCRVLNGCHILRRMLHSAFIVSLLLLQIWYKLFCTIFFVCAEIKTVFCLCTTVAKSLTTGF